MNINKILSNKIFKSFILFSLFRAVYGFVIVLIAYFFTQKYNLTISGSIPILILSIFISRYFFKKFKLRFNL